MARAAGLTYAAFSLFGVFAPFLGNWADRTGRHRDLLIWGTMSAGALLLLFDFVSEPLRILLAAGAGLGAMATTTAGNVLAIQGQPEPLWDARVAILQRYISAGQVIGLGARRTVGGQPPWLRLCRRRPGASGSGSDGRLYPLRPVLPAVRRRNLHRGQWWAGMPVFQGRITAVTTCPGRSFAPISG